jgi:hypothetical protein
MRVQTLPDLPLLTLRSTARPGVWRPALQAAFAAAAKTGHGVLRQTCRPPAPSLWQYVLRRHCPRLAHYPLAVRLKGLFATWFSTLLPRGSPRYFSEGKRG